VRQQVHKASADFADGFWSFARAIRLMARTRRLWPFALIPFVFGLGLVFYGLSWGVSNLPILVEMVLLQIASLSGLYFTTIYWIALILIWPAFLIALIYSIFLSTRLIAGPFHALLAERALMTLGVLKEQPFAFGPWLQLTARMFIVSLLRTILFAFAGLLLFIVSLIPGLNFLAVMGFCLILAFDSADYSFEAMQMGLRKRLSFFLAHFWRFSGLAVGLGLVFLIPGFNFFLFPLAVVAGSDVIATAVGGRADKIAEAI